MAEFVYAKKGDETFQEYRDRAINSLSNSFCGAKWYNATIWLNMGQTTSCHHPPANYLNHTKHYIIRITKRWFVKK